MARNRVIYQSEALYVSKNVNSTGSSEHRQLTRVQSANYNFEIARQDVNQFGQLARIDALVLTSPTVSLDFCSSDYNGQLSRKTETCSNTYYLLKVSYSF